MIVLKSTVSILVDWSTVKAFIVCAYSRICRHKGTQNHLLHSLNVTTRILNGSTLTYNQSKYSLPLLARSCACCRACR